ncbi:methyltransferase domain-containing protein [Cohnella sp. CFH 77786]|nr:methyltransferase domain-containing protein [Cohnella sp. CFH 77786]
MEAELSGENAGKPEAYPQTGVANTCRSYREYMDMFGLEEEDLNDGPVLDVAGGASSFTAQLRGMGIPAVAADPFYGRRTEDVLADARTEIEVSSAKIAAAAASFDWGYYGSPQRHREMRENSFALFAADYVREDARPRYVAASLPRLPFADGTFRLALCSHFLFLYADAFGETFHREALAELLRVVRPGGEVRVYPLVSLRWESSPYLPALLSSLERLADVGTVPTRLPFTPVRSEVLRLVKIG